MFCPSCGFEQPQAKVCAQCGAPLAAASKHGFFFWLAVAAAAMVLLCGGGAFLIFAGIVNSEASEIAEAFVRESADVRKFVGGTPDVAWLREGSISTQGVSGQAHFVLTATGPRGEAKVVVDLLRAGDAWGISNAGLVGADGSVSAISRERVRSP